MLNRMIRRAVPSISKLTYNPLFKVPLDAASWLTCLPYQEFKGLPPNHMRIRVGVGNRLLFNEPKFLSSAKYWMSVLGSGWVRLDSTIVDIGCGCGRYANSLRIVNNCGIRYTGKYIGIDIDEEMIEWCRANYDPKQWTFFLSSDRSSSYAKPGTTEARYRLEVADESADYVFSMSLFSHLLEQEMMNYLEESYRILRSGGRMAHSVFSMDRPPPTGGRHTFSHSIGAANVESLDQPEAAVAYSEEFLIRAAQGAGFNDVEVISSETDWQPLLIVRK